MLTGEALAPGITLLRIACRRLPATERDHHPVGFLRSPGSRSIGTYRRQIEVMFDRGKLET
jgi:hypothetical protein